MEFGEKLQKMRKANRMSQEQLAEKLNVSRQAVSKWEGGALPDVDNIVKISTFFDCSLDYLMSNQEEVKKEHEIKVEHEKSGKVRILSWDIKWLMACSTPICVLLVIWTLANVSNVALHIRDASTGKMFSKFLTYVSDYNLYIYVYGSLICLYTFVTIKCLYPIVKEKNRKQSILRIVLWLIYMLGIIILHNSLLNPKFFFFWSGWNFASLILYLGLLLFLEVKVTNCFKVK